MHNSYLEICKTLRDTTSLNKQRAKQNTTNVKLGDKGILLDVSKPILIRSVKVLLVLLSVYVYKNKMVVPCYAV